MGCYDHIKLETAVKCKCGKELGNFQSKSLGSAICSYVITKDGRFREDWKRYVDGKRRAKKYVYFEDISFGFYTYCDCGLWHDFYAIFLNGKLKKLKHTLIHRPLKGESQ